MNGHLPIAGSLSPHALAEHGVAHFRAKRGFIHGCGLTQKSLQLQQCARIGFTPPETSRSHAFPYTRAPLEVSPCRNNIRS